MSTQEPENLAGAPEQRVEALRRRLVDDPRSLAFVSLAEELNRAGAYDEAANVAQQGLLNHPDSVAGRLVLAVAEAEKDNVREALEQIKRALIIDQENPKALALMGRILLKRGLAKRAVQFLSHAVKLAPTEAAYGNLLQEARRQAQETAPKPPPPPVFDGDAVPAEEAPWTEDGPTREVDHTVFDPDAVNRMARGDPGLRSVPHPQPGSAAAKKAKMGGSAADYSQMMRRADLPNDPVPPESEPTEASVQALSNGRGPADEPPMPATDPEPRPAVPVSGAAEAGSSRPAMRSNADSAPSKPAAEASEEGEKPAKVAVAKLRPKRDGDKPDARVATRMVDDALWALFGKKGASDADGGAVVDVPSGPEKPAVDGAAVPASSEAPARPRVVRTSERFGTWASVATMTVLSVAGAFVGHWITLSSAGPGPEVTSEEVKGLATDLERGGLAALLAAEEKSTQLARSAPDLAPLLGAVNAEIYGRRWRAFGREPEMREKARTAIAGLSGRRPTVEHVAGLVALSTSTADHPMLIGELRALAERYPESPKVRALRAQVQARAGHEKAALRALYDARGLHANHRLTLLELARWYRRAGAHATSLRTYEQLLEHFPLDIEAAIERYVLGQVTGADPKEAEAVSLLAGLVREEDPAVAKDETGRAALAFAVPMLARGQLVEGIEELGKAEAAFERSAAYKMAVAGAYLAVGEFDRAEVLYKQAAKLAPDALARATSGPLHRRRRLKRPARARRERAHRRRARAHPSGCRRFAAASARRARTPRRRLRRALSRAPPQRGPRALRSPRRRAPRARDLP